MNDLFRIGLLVLVMVFLNRTAAAQEGLLHGIVLDEVNSRPLVGAHVQVVGRAGGTVTNEEGRFSLAWDRRTTMGLRVSHVGHTDLDRELKPPGPIDNAPLILRLKRGVRELRPVEIGVRKPEVVYQRKDLHVGGYHANAQGLWVLVYEKAQLWHREEHAGEQLYRNARLHLLDTAFRELGTVALPGMVRQLVHDHRNRTIVEGQEQAWMAELIGTEIRLARMDRKTLKEEVLPWTDSIPGHLLGTTRNEVWPAFDHIAYDPGLATALAICSVEDKHVMQLFRSQYKYMSGRDKVMAMDLEIETGVDREVIAGFMTGFQHDQYFRVPYAPLFVVNDTLCVFDHTSGTIRRFTQDLRSLQDVTMVHHREKGWRSRLLQDPVNGRVYAEFARNSITWLREVQATTGILGPVVKLTHPYPEEVQVFDGYAYYVYRPQGSLQHRTLYREALY